MLRQGQTVNSKLKSLHWNWGAETKPLKIWWETSTCKWRWISWEAHSHSVIPVKLMNCWIFRYIVIFIWQTPVLVLGNMKVIEFKSWISKSLLLRGEIFSSTMAKRKPNRGQIGKADPPKKTKHDEQTEASKQSQRICANELISSEFVYMSDPCSQSSEWELHRAYICAALHLLIFSERPEPVFSVTTSWFPPNKSSPGNTQIYSRAAVHAQKLWFLPSTSCCVGGFSSGLLFGKRPVGGGVISQAARSVKLYWHYTKGHTGRVRSHSPRKVQVTWRFCCNTQGDARGYEPQI